MRDQKAYCYWAKNGTVNQSEAIMVSLFNQRPKKVLLLILKGSVLQPETQKDIVIGIKKE